MVDGSPRFGTVLVCGARFAGATIVRALAGRSHDILVTDDRLGDAPDIAALGARFVGALTSLPDGVDLVVTSPGWRPDHPVFVSARRRGVEIIGEVEFAWRLRGPGAAPWLAVTGTNGKTTTVRMLESILRASGARALAAGNVGVSIIDAVVADEPYDVLAVELSSYQLYWSSTVTPAAGALLNLAPDHLDWHGTMADYAAVKTRIWDAAIAVGNRDDLLVAELLTSSAAAPRRVGFTLQSPTPGNLGVRNGVLIDEAFGAGSLLLPTEQIRPAGPHNVANALAAAALARAYGVDAHVIAEGLRTFVPDPHRNELVLTRDDVQWVDDSKATNPHAASASMRAYPKIVWIAGGQLKNAPVDELVGHVADRLVAVVLLGADRQVLANALQRHAPDVPVIEVASTDDGAMTEAVSAAAGFARPGDTVLLAPAAASYDMFTGYAARGDAFAAAARALDPT